MLNACVDYVTLKSMIASRRCPWLSKRSTFNNRSPSPIKAEVKVGGLGLYGGWGLQILPASRAGRGPSNLSTGSWGRVAGPSHASAGIIHTKSLENRFFHIHAAQKA